MNQIIELIQQVQHTVNSNSQLIQIILRKKLGKSATSLQDEVVRRGRMDVNDVKDFTNFSKEWSLTLMRKLSKLPGFRFRVGDSGKRLPSVIVYQASLLVQDQYRKLTGMLQNKEKVSIMDIMEEFAMDLKKAKNLALGFVEENKEYVLHEDNKIVRKATINK